MDRQKWLQILQTFGPIVAIAAGAPPDTVNAIVGAAAAAESLFTSRGSGPEKLDHAQKLVQASIAVNNSIEGAPQLDPALVHDAVAAVVPAVISTVNAIHDAQQKTGG